MDHDFQKATNMKLIFCVFEQLSGLKINFHKIDYFALGRVNNMSKNMHNCLVAG
jgi:hypothetical protein